MPTEDGAATERRGHARVVDASALLAFLDGRPGSERVELALADGAMVGALDLAEVVGRLAEHGAPVDGVERALEALDLRLVPFDGRLAYLAGRLRADVPFRRLPLGTCACLALAARGGHVVLTADPTLVAVGRASGVVVDVLGDAAS